MIKLLDVNPLVKNLPLNTIGRDFVVGDLHGCMHLLEILFKEVDFDETIDRLISVGDLVDRGRYSMKCLKLLEKPWFHCVMGNHEDLLRSSIIKYLMMNDLYSGPPLEFVAVRNYASTHLNNGGEWIEEYLLTAGNEEEKKQFCFDYLKRLNDLPLVLVVGAEKPADRYNVVHSEIYVPFQPVTDAVIDEQELLNRHGLIWERSMFVWNRRDVLDYPLNFQSLDMSWTYCGHTPVQYVTKIAQQINIDTCAFYADFISKDRNGDNGLTIVNPINLDFWQVNGATQEIGQGNLGHPERMSEPNKVGFEL